MSEKFCRQYSLPKASLQALKTKSLDFHCNSFTRGCTRVYKWRANGSLAICQVCLGEKVFRAFLLIPFQNQHKQLKSPKITTTLRSLSTSFWCGSEMVAQVFDGEG